MAHARVLLVDDSADTRHFLADVLRPAGYDVLTAASGEEGFTLARDLLPDLIIADHQMPGQTGLDMLAALREQDIRLPFILITAQGSEELAARALRLGVGDYLIKPFDVGDLIKATKRVLAEHWQRQIQENVPVRLLQANIELEGRLRELDTLVQIGQRVTGVLDLQTVLREAAQAAVTLAQAEEGSLLLVDPLSGELYLYASTDAELMKAPFRLPVADSLAGRVVRTGESLIITGEDLQTIKPGHTFRALAYVPLVLKGDVIGVLGVTNHTANARFHPHVIQLLSVIADFAAIAIENARLYTRTERERSTLDAILRDTEDTIIVVDAVDNVLFCNPAARKTFDVNILDYRGKPLDEVINHQEVIELFAKQARAGRSRSSEIKIDDGKRVLNAQLTIVEGVGRVVVMQDITHLKELDRIKSDFVTTVSHDLRGPLTAILSYVELINRSGPLNDSQQDFIKRIKFSVQSITALISDLLELGKIEAGFDQDREPTSLRRIVRYAVEGQRHQWEKKQQHVKVRLPEIVPSVLGNPLRLRQLVNNLVENAVKYTPDGGTVTIMAESDGEFLILRVIDTGIGIPQKDQPYIFDKFYRTDQAIDHYQGTGLGLSIVKSIVDQHNGRIWVESEVGKGTTFTVMLPVYDGDAGGDAGDTEA
ncbi:MAG: response regulator [Anaerolineae bacterium]|nr:response regulator [Anaerolineae bacterium]